MVQIKDLPLPGQKIVYGALSRAVIENLLGTAPFYREDEPFANAVYNQWTGSDQLLKEVAAGQFSPDGAIYKTLVCIQKAHSSYVAIFEQASSALEVVRENEMAIRATCEYNAQQPFFTKPDLATEYKAHVVSILRQVDEFGELELLDEDDEDEQEASDDEDEQSDESNESNNGSDESEDEEEDEEQADSASDDDDDDDSNNEHEKDQKVTDTNNYEKLNESEDEEESDEEQSGSVDGTSDDSEESESEESSSKKARTD